MFKIPLNPPLRKGVMKWNALWEVEGSVESGTLRCGTVALATCGTAAVAACGNCSKGRKGRKS